MNEKDAIRKEHFRSIYGPSLLVSFIWLVLLSLFANSTLVGAYLDNDVDFGDTYCKHMLSLATLLAQISCVSLAILDYCSSAGEKKGWLIFLFFFGEGALIFFNYRIVSLCFTNDIEHYRLISIRTAYVFHGLFLALLWLCKFLTEVHNNKAKIIATSFKADGIIKNRQ